MNAQTVTSIVMKGFSCECLPDGLDVHGLGMPRPLPGQEGRRQEWCVTPVGLLVSRVGGVHVRSVRVAVVQEQRRVRLRRVHALHGGVHLIDQLLQIHIIICEGSVDRRGKRKRE